MQMVQILLLFTRAQRDGIWELHLSAFRSMLPYFMRYNHTNYARWGTVYLNDMHQLSQEVKKEFDAGNFVIKRTPHRFNQVDPDQSQEWLNAVGKNGGGIIGITKTPSALSRWTLFYNLRSHLALETRAVFAGGSDDDLVHNETTKSRMKQDTKDEDSLVTTLESFTLFSSDLPHTLQNIANKDLVTEAIEADLLAAETKGQDQLNSFVEERLMAFPKNSFWRFPHCLKSNAQTYAQELRKQSKQTETFCSVSSLPMKLGEMSISRMSEITSFWQSHQQLLK